MTDKNGNSAESGEFSLKMLKNNAVLNLSEANAFARSVRNVSLNVETGKPENYTLQYRTVDGTWKMLTAWLPAKWWNSTRYLA